MNDRVIRFSLNGRKLEVAVRPYVSLLYLLREQLGHTEVKEGCQKGDCGACTVMMDGRAVNACLVLAAQADGTEILTVKGLAKRGELDPLQDAFVEHGAIQCGFCTPGLLMSATALLRENPHPTRQEIKEAISGNLCRCTGYEQVVEAIEAVALKSESQNG